MNAAAAGEHAANDTRLSQAPMIEHVVVYQFDALNDNELSLAVDDRVWVSASHITVQFLRVYVNCAFSLL